MQQRLTQALAALPGDSHRYPNKIVNSTGAIHLNAHRRAGQNDAESEHEVLEVKLGSAVMSVVNAGKLSNGTRGVVTDFVLPPSRPVTKRGGASPPSPFPDHPVVRWSSERHGDFEERVDPLFVLLERGATSCTNKLLAYMPIMGADAMTVHKAVGQTLRNGVVLDCSGGLPACHQLYEALSRPPSFGHLQVGSGRTPVPLPALLDCDPNALFALFCPGDQLRSDLPCEVEQGSSAPHGPIGEIGCRDLC